ncbi:MAG: hypothetical protein LCI00_11090 [Chloroflexi bacterium]|nr:hypothetical protein [Chloroflexota bacterium]MCC6891901.1 hypothetical protein [Anaerolineae bacterium]
MLNARTILLVIHIICAGLWIAQFFTTFIFERLIRTHEGKPAELTLMLAQIKVSSIAGMIAGNGILLSGLGLLAVSHLGLLGIGGTITPPWLFIKQIIYIILLLIVFVGINPIAIRLQNQITAAANGAAAATPEMRADLNRLRMIVYAHDAFVLINIILAVAKFN